jgi:cysteinyl-tRNA synthetase
MLESLARHGDDASAAMQDGDTVAAADAILAFAETLRAWSADTQQSDEMDRGRADLQRHVVALARLAQRGVRSRAEIVEPFVTTLLAERDRARGGGDYAVADRIRDALVAAGIEVRDTPDGARWRDRQR